MALTKMKNDKLNVSVMECGNLITNFSLGNQDLKIQRRDKLFRIFTGSIENVNLWSKLKNQFEIIFELIGIVIYQIGRWNCEKIINLCDSKTGRLITRNHFQAFKINIVSEEEKNDCQRISYICKKVADEINNLSIRKS
ncbi:hypothetical protein Phum_PHUM061070 [Pediculus humanus corporis]|uniref:Uncharacterized protein n=1 Tax=Pediculus humanus subsp. corporis TaxID=121224 RepID=E0VBH4_PEDHC|nr:uncharacterized protein Phum_PHUM061070 [Pediculus humanus corporis]EEB10730.1 hypothetical protein Phum_PHUM061070 [Pediculus humanus corporis]